MCLPKKGNVLYFYPNLTGKETIRNNEKYQSLMKFFIQGNEQTYLNLIEYLETGKPTVNY